MSRRLPVRWITLAEGIALTTVVIGGLGLYNSWNRAETPAPAPAQPLLLRAEADREGGGLALSPAAPSQVVQDQRLTFPKALGVAPVETSGSPRIEASWLEDALDDATKGSRAPAGDRQLPVLVRTTLIENGVVRRDVSLYRIGYTLSGGGLIGDRDLTLHGLALIGHTTEAAGARRLESLWKPAR